MRSCFRRWLNLVARRAAARHVALTALRSAARRWLRAAFVPWAHEEVALARARSCCQRMALQATGVTGAWKCWRRAHMRFKVRELFAGCHQCAHDAPCAH